jgi:2-oxoglutarate/2-oxoacid ferredoxin oxidoreductase subunit beta
MAEGTGHPFEWQGAAMTEASGGVETLTRKDFVSDQEVRWCPGCGDYAILAAIQSGMPDLGVPREKTVFVSGIGCASRFPYYMDTYGLHGIHGRAPAIATGIAASRPDLTVWVVMGDGDALSIGGNHLIHALRRNVNLKLLMFNNQIYGLTKGQYSPTSEQGKVTKSTPFGSLERPFNPISVALGAEATFVARTMDVDRKHLPTVVKRAAAHRGSAFVEIYQNCNIFNDGAFMALSSKEGGTRNRIYLEHGKPIRFGPNDDKGVVMRSDGEPEIVDVSAVGEDKLLVHDEKRDNPALAFALSRLAEGPTQPTPFGVFRAVERPVYGDAMEAQLRTAAEQQGPGELKRLLTSGDVWEVT